MLTIEIRINGSVISALTAINRGGIERCRYEYQGATFPIDNGGPVRPFQGFLEHTRSDGAEVLAALLLCEVASAVGHDKK
jgi:hypothetical protein